MWVDKDGKNYTSLEIVTELSRMVGAAYSVESLEQTFKVGRIYENGIWYQRLS